MSYGTLCWACGNACGGCEWSALGKPVKGWTAKKTLIRNMDCAAHVRYEHSYKVIACPKFVNDVEQYSPDTNVPNYRQEPTPTPHPITNKSPARKRLEELPEEELYKRIETRLEGTQKEVAKLVLIGKLRVAEVERILFYGEGSLRNVLRKIYSKLEAV